MTIFNKILNGEVKADFLHEDDKCIVINDIHPQGDVHMLVIPKKEISSLLEMGEIDRELIGHMNYIGMFMAKQKGLAGCKAIFNVGKKGGQEIPYLHLHIIGNY